MRNLPVNPGVNGVNTACRRKRVIEISEDHRKHVPKRALEATDDVAARLRVMIDCVSDHRMRELEQRSASAAEEDGQIAAELPCNRMRAEDALGWIADLFRYTCERRFELFTRDDRHLYPS